jgi:hypothetical protein
MSRNIYIWEIASEPESLDAAKEQCLALSSQTIPSFASANISQFLDGLEVLVRDTGTKLALNADLVSLLQSSERRRSPVIIFKLDNNVPFLSFRNLVLLAHEAGLGLLEEFIEDARWRAMLQGGIFLPYSESDQWDNTVFRLELTRPLPTKLTDFKKQFRNGFEMAVLESGLGFKKSKAKIHKWKPDFLFERPVPLGTQYLSISVERLRYGQYRFSFGYDLISEAIQQIYNRFNLPEWKYLYLSYNDEEGNFSGRHREIELHRDMEDLFWRLESKILPMFSATGDIQGLNKYMNGSPEFRVKRYSFTTMAYYPIVARLAGTPDFEEIIKEINGADSVLRRDPEHAKGLEHLLEYLCSEVKPLI